MEADQELWGGRYGRHDPAALSGEQRIRASGAQPKHSRTVGRRSLCGRTTEAFEPLVRFRAERRGPVYADVQFRHEIYRIEKVAGRTPYQCGVVVQYRSCPAANRYAICSASGSDRRTSCLRSITSTGQGLQRYDRVERLYQAGRSVQPSDHLYENLRCHEQ